MCRQSLREADMRGEGIVKEYLIRYFYERIRNNGILTKIRDYRPIYEIEQQLQGIDTILYCNDGRELIIDEKCALSYINKELPTFAFEIQWSRYGEPIDGWFINDDQLKTQYYFTMWLEGSPIINELTGQQLEGYRYIERMTIDDLKHIELYVINKKTLRNHLSDRLGLTVTVMKDRAAQLIDGGIAKSMVNRNISFVYSERLTEKPVNLVINKSVLRQIADATFEITSNQVKRNGIIIYEAP